MLSQTISTNTVNQQSRSYYNGAPGAALSFLVDFDACFIDAVPVKKLVPIEKEA
jgi:hypothetical protein